MNCYNCGCELSDKDFCTACGADVSIFKKIIRLSNYYYNEGLQKAQVRDLSGAAKDLRQSLKCHKYNTEARNLLGLVYFEMGEAVDALSEWVISKNFQPKKNIADDYLNAIQSNPTKWDNIRQTIRKYNQGLEYCRQDSIDLAIIQLKSVVKANPKMIRGRLLLSLLYLYNEEWDKALRHLNTVLKIDANNTQALLYIKEANAALEAIEAAEEAAGKKKKKPKKKDVITYTSGNEVIIQPINHSERSGYLVTAVNIAIGVIIGLAFMWFVILPSRVRSAESDAQDKVRQVSGELTEKSVSVDELNKRIEALEDENSKLIDREQQITGSNGILSAADVLMTAARSYIEEPDGVLDVARSLNSIDESYLEGDENSTQSFRDLYDSLKQLVAPAACEELIKTADNYVESKAYSSAIDTLNEAVAINPENASALLKLGNAYRLNSDATNAALIYRQVVDTFPDSSEAKTAQKYLEGKDLEEKKQETEEAPAAEAEAAVVTPIVEVTPVIPDVNVVNPTEVTVN